MLKHSSRARFTNRLCRLKPRQGRNEVRWHRGQKKQLGAPMIETEVFPKQMYCIEKVLVTSLELLGAPIVIRRTGNCAPLAPLVTPLSLGPQDPNGPSANYGTHKVNYRFVVCSINIHQNFVSSLFMKLSFIHLIRFRVDNARVFQRISMNLNMTVGQDGCPPICRHTQRTLAASCIWWIMSIVTCESGERTCGCLCLKCTWSKLKVLLLIRTSLCVGLAALSYNKKIVACTEQYCSFVSASIT